MNKQLLTAPARGAFAHPRPMVRGLASAFLRVTRLALAALLISAATAGAATYTWQGAAGASWATAGNWNPTRTTPAVTDVLQFNGGGTKSATAVPTQTIGQLIISGSTAVTLTSTTGTITLSIGQGIAGTDLDVQSGSSLTLANGGTSFTVAYTAGQTGTAGSIAGTLNVNSATTWNVTGGTTPTTSVSGTVANAATVTGTAATLTFASGGLYQHKFTTTAGTIPTATWSTGSTCAIIGYTTWVGSSSTGLPGFAGQTFYDVTWNCSGQTAASTPNLIAGTAAVTMHNFTVVSTGAGVLHFRLTGAAGSPTYNITGDFIVQGGTIDLDNNGGTSGDIVTVNLAGNYNQTRGSVLSTSTQTGTDAVINFTGANKTFTQSVGAFNTVASRIDIKVNSGASLTLNNNLPTLAGYGVTVLSGGTLNAGTSLVTGTGTFTNAVGGTLVIGSADGITSSGATGNIQTVTRIFNAGAKYTYNGTGAQVTGNGLPATLTNTVTIANAAGVTLSQSTIVNTPGSFVVNNGALLTMGAAINLTGTGTFTLSSGGTLAIASTAGITSSGATGNIQTTTRTFPTTANYTYNGTAAQVTGNGLPATVNNLSINNSTGVTLSGAETISGTLALASAGLLKITTTSQNSTAHALTINGAAQPAGTWGSTGSAATYRDNTRFDSTGTGIVTVGSGSSAYRITAATSTPAAGTTDQLTITLVDASGNTITSFSGRADSRKRGTLG